MDNPFDAATPAMIECYEANERAYAQGLLKPNYRVPAIRQCYCGYSLEQHKDNMPCATLGCIQY